jgi:regulator of extracellular matrix RemA (YlzA/DUF370 family)
MSYVDVGFSNFVEANKILTISRPDSSPIRRMVKEAKDEGRYIDLTQGKKTRSIIISTGTTGPVVIGSAVLAQTIIGRLDKAKGKSSGFVSGELISTLEASAE